MYTGCGHRLVLLRSDDWRTLDITRTSSWSLDDGVCLGCRGRDGRSCADDWYRRSFERAVPGRFVFVLFFLFLFCLLYVDEETMAACQIVAVCVIPYRCFVCMNTGKTAQAFANKGLVGNCSQAVAFLTSESVKLRPKLQVLLLAQPEPQVSTETSI